MSSEDLIVKWKRLLDLDPPIYNPEHAVEVFEKIHQAYRTHPSIKRVEEYNDDEFNPQMFLMSFVRNLLTYNVNITFNIDHKSNNPLQWDSNAPDTNGCNINDEMFSIIPYEIMLYRRPHSDIIGTLTEVKTLSELYGDYTEIEMGLMEVNDGIVTFHCDIK